jgi:hypothetical protein
MDPPYSRSKASPESMKVFLSQKDTSLISVEFHKLQTRYLTDDYIYIKRAFDHLIVVFNRYKNILYNTTKAPLLINNHAVRERVCTKFMMYQPGCTLSMFSHISVNCL